MIEKHKDCDRLYFPPFSNKDIVVRGDKGMGRGTCIMIKLHEGIGERQG